MSENNHPIFSGKNFPVWKMSMEIFLGDKDLKKFLKTSSDVKEESNVNLDQRALGYIFRSMRLQHARPLLTCKTAKAAWDKLCSIHENRSEANKFGIQRTFFSATMEKNESIAAYVSRIEYYKEQMEDAGISVATTTVISRTLLGLPPSYKGFCTTFNGYPESQRNMVFLLAKLLEEEELQERTRLALKKGTAFNTDEPRGSEDRPKGNGNKNAKRRGKGKGKGKPGKCFKCGKEGLWADKCRSKGDASQPSSKKDSKDNRSGTGPAQAVIAESNLSDSSKSEWILDSGATEHMSYDRGSFTNYCELDTKKPIRVGNNAVIYGLGYGDIRVKSYLSDGRVCDLILKDVLHVPHIGRKLFSASTTTAQGNNGQMTRDRIIIRNQDGEELIEAQRSGQLYIANIRELDGKASVAECDDLNLWHERFGHISKQRLIKMAKAKAVEGLDSIANASVRHTGARQVIDCRPCLIGKQPRQHFGDRTQPKATKVGDRVHVDICGPIATATLGGNHFFVLFKDEYSSFRHVYFIKNRSEAYDQLRLCVASYRGELDSPMKSLFSDHGSEFTSNRTQEFLKEHVIHHSMSAPFTPSQNGLIERDNRTVFESARSMLAARGLPHHLWGEAVMTAVYLLNRSINSRSDITPFEMVFNRKPRTSHLRIFGSLVYVKEQEKKRSGYQKKLGDRARPTLMVGYEPRDFTYRLYDANSKSILQSREVHFDERPGSGKAALSEHQDSDTRDLPFAEFVNLSSSLKKPISKNSTKTIRTLICHTVQQNC